MAGRVTCSATIGTSVAKRGAEHHRDLVVFPRMEVDHLAFREELGHCRLEDAEVSTRVLGRLGSGVAGDPEHLANLELAILCQLRKQAHRPVLEIRERAVCRARAPEAVEVVEWVGGHVDRGQAHGETGIAELGDLGRQHRAGDVGVALVPAPTGHVGEVLAEACEVGRLGQVCRRADEQRPPVLLLGKRVHVRAPGAVRGAVGMLFARLLPDFGRIGMSVEQALVAEDRASVAEIEAVRLLGDRGGDLEQSIGQPVGQLGLAAEERQRGREVGACLRLPSAGVRWAPLRRRPRRTGRISPGIACALSRTPGR